MKDAKKEKIEEKENRKRKMCVLNHGTLRK